MFKKTTKTIFVFAVAVALCATMVWSPPASASDPFIAQIVMFGGNFAPRNWALCDGQLLPINQNQSLFSLLGTTYGGDGRTTFALPDLRGRVAIHPGNGPGLQPINLGQKGGLNNVTLTQVPAHVHGVSGVTADLNAYSGNGNMTSPTGNVLANDPREDQYSNQTPDVTMNSASVALSGNTDNTGGNTQFSIMQPFQGINHIIALVGVFPSRN